MVVKADNTLANKDAGAGTGMTTTSTLNSAPAQTLTNKPKAGAYRIVHANQPEVEIVSVSPILHADMPVQARDLSWTADIRRKTSEEVIKKTKETNFAELTKRVSG